MRDVRDDIRRACRTAVEPIALHRQVAGLLVQAVPFDRWCGMVIDPATLLGTGGFHEEGLPSAALPRLIEIEAGEPDVNTFPELSRTSTGVSTLHRATRGRAGGSIRYREVLAPSGLGRELRAVLRDRTSVWGGLVLLRESDRDDFSDAELAFVADVSADLARGIRRSLVLSEMRHRDSPRVPGMVLLDLAGDDVAVQLSTGAAQHWLADVPDDRLGPSGLPVAAVSLAMRARARPEEPVSARLRSRTGRWLTMHAEVLEPGPPARVALVVEPTRPHELAEVVAAAYGLSPREREVARLVVSGHSNRDIAETLWLSPWTVQDHLKSIFAKLDVGTRAEMTSRMFFDQYLPRITRDEPLGADGWFVGS